MNTLATSLGVVIILAELAPSFESPTQTNLRAMPGQHVLTLRTPPVALIKDHAHKLQLNSIVACILR
jgi:hypothetical protein